MLDLDKKLKRAALNYGKWREVACKSQTMKDRIQFVHSETRLGMAAQAVYEREQRRVTKRRSKG